MRYFAVIILAGVVCGAQNAHCQGKKASDVVAEDSGSQPAPPVHPWQRFTRGFRAEHNFALTLNMGSAAWTLNRFGSMRGRTFSTRLGSARFQYSFHLPVYRGFGAFLGSSLGVQYETGGTTAFKPASGVSIPGFLTGFVLNFNPVLRSGVSVEYYAERWNDLEEKDGLPPEATISATAEAMDFGLFTDVFYQLNWAIRIEGHARLLSFPVPQKAQGQAVDASISKEDRWLGLGIVYHLL